MKWTFFSFTNHLLKFLLTHFLSRKSIIRFGGFDFAHTQRYKISNKLIAALVVYSIFVTFINNLKSLATYLCCVPGFPD